MILVIGRPALDGRADLGGRAALIALAASRAGGRVELVGSVGDDGDGDAVVVQLGRAGIGHAALLRDPAGVTPRSGEAAAGPSPRLDPGDVELGLHYLVECRVLVLAEWLGEEVLEVARRAAAYHQARLIVLLDPAADEPQGLPRDTTVLRVPEEDGGAFAELVGRYASLLAEGNTPAEAWRRAMAGSGWSESENGAAESPP